MTYLMEPHSGIVMPEEEWFGEYEDMDPGMWGGDEFEDAELIEVVPNIPGSGDYDEQYGDWRPSYDEE